MQLKTIAMSKKYDIDPCDWDDINVSNDNNDISEE